MILRICVVLATCDDLRTVSEVVKDILLATPFPVLVVDDGSSAPVENVLYSWEVRQALESGRVKVERFSKNRGKGAALSFAITELASRGFTHILTMDADGSHRAEEIAKLTELAKSHPWDVIIGTRRKTAGTEAVKFGSKLADFFVRYETGSHFKDPGSGFRLYPLFPLQNIKFVASRRDFEMEVLIRLLWLGVQVRETDLDIPFANGAGATARYDRWIDRATVSLMNALLMAVALVKRHRRPRELATAMGLGVFVGCTPLFGFHTLIVAALAFALRLNFVVMWVGSHVSTPLIAPLVVMLEIWIGRHWMHIEPGGGPKGDILQWVGGSLVLGVILSLTATLATYAIAKSLNRPRALGSWAEAQRSRLRRGFFGLILRHCGIRSAYFLAHLMALYFYVFSPRARNGLSEYWKILEPRDTWRRRQGRILRHFYRFEVIAIDQEFNRLHAPARFTADGTGSENISEALKMKKGLVLLSAHVGAWDLAARLLGLEFPVATADQAVSGAYELIPFFGKLALFDMSLFFSAAGAQLPVVFGFGFKGEDNAYELFTRPAKTYSFSQGEPIEVQCYGWAEEYVRDLEHFVRRYPDQWFNFYPYWSSLPATAAADQVTRHRFLEEMKSAPAEVNHPAP